MTRRSVDLPLPLGPMRATIAAAGDVEVDAVEDRQAAAVAARERQVDAVDADRADGAGPIASRGSSGAPRPRAAAATGATAG